MSEKYRYLAILGHGGGRQEGGRKWAGGGEGDSNFFCRVGEALFAPVGEKGTVKLHKEP